jgi:hypothetical protein
MVAELIGEPLSGRSMMRSITPRNLNRMRTAQHQVLSFKCRSHSEQGDERAPDQSAKIPRGRTACEHEAGL